MKGKTTKSNSKIMISLFVVLAMILSPITSMFSNFVFAASEQTNVLGSELKIVGYEETVDFNEEYYLPTVNGFTYGQASANDITYEVVRNVPKKTLENTNSASGDAKYAGIYQSEVAEHAGDWCFKATAKGTYTLNIYVGDDDEQIKTLAKSLNIKVNAGEYSISLPTNSEHVIPATIPASITSVNIPRPTVMEDGEEIEDAEYGNLEVKVNDSTPLTYDSSKKAYVYSGLTAGKYQITYSYKVGGSVVARTTRSFNVVSADSYKLEDLKLNVQFDSAKPETATLGVEVKLPSAHAVDQNGDAINAFIDVKVTHISGETKTDCSTEVKDFKFTPKLAGTYSVTYQAKIALFGETYVSDPAKAEFTIANVKDGQKPTSLAVKDYTVADGKITTVDGVSVPNDATEDDILEMLGDESASIPNVVVIPEGQSQVVMENFLPAVYADDNFTEGYGNFTKLTRQIRKSSTTDSTATTTWRDLEKVQDGAYVTGSYYANNESATVIFNSTGTFKIRYVSSDSSDNSDTSKIFTVVVVKESDLSKYKIAPSISLGNIVSDVYSNETLSFEKPVATDKNSTKLDNNIDVELELRVYATDDSMVGTITIDETYFNEETNKYEVAVNDMIEIATNASKTIKNVELIATAKNDIYNQLELADALATDSRVINVIAVNDATAPVLAFGSYDTTFSQVGFNEGLVANNANLSGKTIGSNGFIGTDEYPFEQGDTIVLPDLQVKEADKKAAVSINVTDAYGNKVALNSKNPQRIAISSVSDGYEIVVSNSNFVATLGGLYTVTYQVTDHYGNITVRSFGIRVNTTEVPTIILANFPKTAELGEFFEYPELTLSDGVSKMNADNSTITLYPADGFAGENGVYGFTPDVTGTYAIEYSGSGITQKFFVEVKDTVKPVITEDYSIGYFAENQFKDKYEMGTAKTVEVSIPMFTVVDPNNNIDKAYADVKVTDPNNGVVTLTTNEENARYTFNAEEGIYKVVYSAKDNGANAATEISFNIEVGNCNYPTISWAETDSIPSTIELGSTFTIPFADLVITDADATTSGDTSDALKELMKGSTDAFKLVGPDGKVVENEYDGEGKGWVYTFDQTGDYTLTVTVRDNASHKTTKSYKINVPAEDADETTNMSNTVGTVLIILSIVVLGGVVVYFLFSSKKANAENKKAKRK